MYVYQMFPQSSAKYKDNLNTGTVCRNPFSGNPPVTETICKALG